MKRLMTVLAGLAWLLPLTSGAENFTAELDWADRVELSVPVSGVVQKVNAESGQAVAAGSLLLSLDTAVFKANLAAAEAQFKSLAIDLEEAQREFNRAEELYASTVLSDRDLQLAEIAYEKVNAQYQAARANVTEARFQLDHATIKAPFDAWVIRRNVMPGEVLMQSYVPKTLLTVAKRDAMRAVARVPVETLARLQPGQSVQLKVNDASLQGVISSIDLQPEQARYAVAIEFAVGDGVRYLPGMKAEVDLP